jgi:hypothetical protein
MSHSRCFCGELVLIAEESFAAFSGVSPDLVGDSRATSKARHQDDSQGTRLRRELRRSAEAPAFRSAIGKSNTGGEDR